MKDRFGREIDYMRISITDRCNLHCSYCMPNVPVGIPHSDILGFEEILRICRAGVTLGIDKFKVTGGEPFMRKGVVEFIASLKAEPGVKEVTLTTNGTMLLEALPKLKLSGIDGVNISLDTTSAKEYRTITGNDRLPTVLSAIEACVKTGIRTKVNCVMLSGKRDQFAALAALARNMPVDVRFIELMPIGCGQQVRGPSCDTVFSRLKRLYPDLCRTEEKRGNGPAQYYRSAQLLGCIGFIGANSHKFCVGCNRVRLTSTGLLKPCLCYDTVIDLRALLRDGATDRKLVKALAGVIFNKPFAHCFTAMCDITEYRMMNQIGG